MSDINSALGLSQLSRLKELVKERNKLLSGYKILLKDLPISFLRIPDRIVSSVHLAVILLNEDLMNKHSRIFDFMRASNIGVQLHYIPVHTQPYYQSLGFFDGQFSRSENYSRRAISIPLFPGLSESQQNYVCKMLRKSLDS